MKLSGNFRTIAIDETEYWDDLPECCTKVFGVYLFKENEATYCASLSPSSWCEFLENAFIGIDNDHPFAEEHAYTNGHEYGHYREFVRVEGMGNSISTARVIEVDDDFESEEEARRVLREAAREDFCANAHEPPILSTEHLASKTPE